MEETNTLFRNLGYKDVKLLETEQLGRGSFGIVCKAQCDLQIYAAKKIYKIYIEENAQLYRTFQSEIDLLKHMHNSNIVQYIGTYEDPDSGDLVLLMELMDESLTHFLESSPGDIPYHTQVNLSYDIAQGISFLHTNGIIHRDLSGKNVLLAGTKAKVADFGMSKFKEGNHIAMTPCPGTPAYMPPEAFNQSPVYTEKLDNFSFGVLLVQTVTKQFPEPTERFEVRRLVDPDSNQTIEAKIDIPEVERRHGHISLIPLDNPLLPIAQDCLQDIYHKRPSSQELCGRLHTLKISVKYEESSQQDAANFKERLQAQNKQIDVKTAENNRLAARLEQATDKLQAHEEESLALIQQIEQRDRQISQLEERLAATVRQPSEGPVNASCTCRWESLPNATADTWAGSSTGLGDKVYVKPDDSMQTPRNKLIYEYNSSKQQWSMLPRHPNYGFTIVNIGCALTTVGGAIDILSFKYISKNLYSYTDGRWRKTPLPMPTRRMTPGAVYHNNALVVAGGSNKDQYLSTVEILNITSRQWSRVSSLPFSMNQPSICIHGDHIYMHNHGFKQEHEVIKCSLTALVQSEPSSRVWERIASLLVRYSTLTSVNGHLIAVGGWDSARSEPTKNVHQYNEVTKSWIEVSQMSVARYFCLTALLQDNKLLVVGGENKEAEKSLELGTFTQ